MADYGILWWAGISTHLHRKWGGIAATMKVTDMAVQKKKRKRIFFFVLLKKSGLGLVNQNQAQDGLKFSHIP